MGTPNETAIGTVANGSTTDAGLLNPTPNQVQTYELKHPSFPGGSMQVPVNKLVEMAQKGVNADVTTQEAREAQKQAERALAIQEDLEALIGDNDPDAFRRMAMAVGAKGDEIEEAVRKLWGGDGEEQPVQNQNQRMVQQAPPPNQKVDFNQFSPDVQRLLLLAEKQRMGTIIDQALDGDQEVRYNMKQYDEAGQQAIRKLVEEKIRGRLDRYNGDFGDGSQILREVLPEVKDILKALGSPRRETAPLGIGPSPDGGGMGGYPTKKPDHVSSNSGSFEQHILETLAHNHGILNQP